MISLRRISLLFAIAFLASSCVKEEWERFGDSFGKDKPTQPEATPRPKSKTKALQGAIAPLVTIEGTQLMSVRGYGLVVDLVDTGGADGPDEVKKYLIKQVRKHQEIGAPGIPTEEIFKGRDAAMVEITGLIPAAAKRGDRFDVVVKALGSQSKSLVGGRLVLGELKLYAETPQGVIEGKPLATATGPVFVSIFDEEGVATNNILLRTGFVLGGGSVTEPRRVRFVLNDPRYAITQQIVARINGRYGGVDPIAVGQSASYVDINIPDEWKWRKRLFLEQVAHTTLNENPSILEKRAVELVQEIDGPDVDFEAISLAWLAIGKIALPHLKETYQHALPDARYYAALAGIRMGDNAAAEVLATFANEVDNKFRLQAIDELGFATNMYGAGETLRKLMDDPDDEVRIRAYRALRRRPHPAITSKVLDKDNLILDVIETGGPFLIYVQRLGEPRIAIFGKQLKCRDDTIFPGERKDGRRLLTQISAKPGDQSLTVIYKGKRLGKASDALAAPMNVGELVEFLGDAMKRDDEEDGGRVRGLAVPYSEIVDVLYTLTKAQSIPAKFQTEGLKEGEEAPVEETRDRQESEY